ncbi:MAG: glutathione S-transferase family protein [Myxococcota bacterium]|nr:glutathione S-transferase family protein [Myxococcota bacterium]
MVNLDVVYGYQLSYFTRKLEAALMLKGIDYRFSPKTMFNLRRIEKRAQTQQVPVLRTSDGAYLKDSTVIMEYLDRRAPARPLYPIGQAGMIVRLVEEWFDEWFPRVVLHYRWNYEACARSAAPRLARAYAPYTPPFIRRMAGRKIADWGRRAVRANGLDLPEVQAYAEALVERVCTRLNAQLLDTPFALGSTPTAVDAVLLGGLRAHLMTDSVPASRLAHLNALVQWTNQVAETTNDEGPASVLSTPFAQCVLEEMSGAYAQYIRANRVAVTQGIQVITLTMDGFEYTVLARPDSEASRARTSQAIRRLAIDDDIDADALLDQYGLSDIF